MPRRIRCRYCGRLFYPDPRCRNPKACRDPACQLRRRYESHKRWCESDPEVMRDRRAANRAWFAHHPGYLREYRAKHPDYVERNREKQRARRRRGGVDKSIVRSSYPVEKQGEYFKLVPVDGGVDKSTPIFVKRVDIEGEYAHSPPC